MNFYEIHKLGFEIAKDEGLPLKTIQRAPKPNIVGSCTSDGHVKIRIQNNQAMWQSTKDQENLRTLAHELAHLKFMHHGKEFWQYAEYLCERISRKVAFVVKPEQVMI